MPPLAWACVQCAGLGLEAWRAHSLGVWGQHRGSELAMLPHLASCGICFSVLTKPVSRSGVPTRMAVAWCVETQL